MRLTPGITCGRRSVTLSRTRCFFSGARRLERVSGILEWQQDSMYLVHESTILSRLQKGYLAVAFYLLKHPAQCLLRCLAARSCFT